MSPKGPHAGGPALTETWHVVSTTDTVDVATRDVAMTHARAMLDAGRPVLRIERRVFPTWTRHADEAALAEVLRPSVRVTTEARTMGESRIGYNPPLHWPIIAATNTTLRAAPKRAPDLPIPDVRTIVRVTDAHARRYDTDGGAMLVVRRDGGHLTCRTPAGAELRLPMAHVDVLRTTWEQRKRLFPGVFDG